MLPGKTIMTSIACIALLAAGSVRAQQVELAWLDRFDGAESFNDYGMALELDGAGNLAVTGFSFIEERPGLFSPRYFTLKYDPSGNRLWERTWDIGQRSDSVDLAIDTMDNVIVTGSVGNSDWATIKYDPDGNLLWSVTYPTNTPFVEGPEQVEVDASGNIYVGGSEINLDSATVIKYDPEGNELWLRRYTGEEGASARAIAVSDGGDVYVVGSMGTPDFAVQFSVVKYDTDGVLEWAQDFGAFNQVATDIAEDVVIDSSGAIVVTGYFNGNALASQDLATYKFAPDGTVLWSDTYGDLDRDAEFGGQVTVDSQDNVIIAATSEDDSFVGDLLLLKYAADGTLLWNELWDGGTGEYDWTTGVAVDESDRIYAVGTGGWFNYYYTVKYDGAGNFQWFERYDGESGGSIPWGVAVGADRGVFVTGESDSFLERIDIVTAKYAQPMSLGAPEPGLPGELNSMTLTWPGVGETIYLVAAGERGSSAVPSCAGATVDLASVRLLGQATVDAQGSATVEFNVPEVAAGKTAYFQAVSGDSCVVSNRVEYRFP